MCITKTNSSEKPGGGGASGGMVAHDRVNGWQVTACRDERSEPPETPPPPAGCTKQTAQLSPRAAPLALCLRRTMKCKSTGILR